MSESPDEDLPIPPEMQYPNKDMLAMDIDSGDNSGDEPIQIGSTMRKKINSFKRMRKIQGRKLFDAPNKVFQDS